MALRSIRGTNVLSDLRRVMDTRVKPAYDDLFSLDRGLVFGARSQLTVADSLWLYQTDIDTRFYFYVISMKGHPNELHLARHQGSEARAT
jgi:hypothetical protein